MLRWDAQDEMRVSITGVEATPFQEASQLLDACTLPLVVHDYQRAAVLGTATLVLAGRRLLLLTAAHVFDGGVRFGNLMAPCLTGHHLVPLAGSRLTVAGGVDIAVLDIGALPGAAALVAGRRPARVSLAALRRRRTRAVRTHGGGAHVLVSGYPSALSRFERGWLAARRFTVITRGREEGEFPRHRADRLFDFGRVAKRADGVAVHTPELPGMSGAGIWALEPAATGTRLRLEAVQSTYVHGRYLRGHAIGAAMELFGD